jgi:transcriptional regulator with XRE-family HTH domain
MNRRVNGAALATIRKALGMQQVALAADAGITAQFLSQIEHGVRQPAPDVAKRLADALGASLHAITYPVPEVPDEIPA